MKHTPIDHEEIQQLAFQLWERAHSPPGRDLDFWLAAEHQLRAMHEARDLLASKAGKVEPNPVYSKRRRVLAVA